MTSFPTVHDLAAATEEQVNSHWAGLGFYRRARFLHQGAKHVVKELNGEIPQEVDSLMKLPGIGRYTASAIASITFDKPVAVVDGNVCRVLSRLTGIANHIKAPILKDKLGWDLANQLVLADDDGKYAGEVNQALMELGATYCAPSGTGVDPRDPLKDYYKSTKLGRAFLDATETVVPSSGCEICDMAGVKTAMEKFQAGIEQDTTTEDAAKCGHATFPLDPPKKKKREEDLAIAAVSNVYNNETWWLLVKRPPQGLLAGQWEFPNVCVQTRNAKSKEPTSTKLDAALTRYLQEDLEQKWIAELDRTSVQPAPMEHIFSHVKHIMWIASCISRVELDQLEWITARDKEVRWMREKDMTEVGITSGVKKILKAVKGHSKTKSQRKRKR
jgi:A/G-specific adenine glycosylase